MRLVRSTVLIMSAAGAVTAGGVAVAQDNGDESAKDPKAIVADAARDLAKVKSFHFAGTDVEKSGTTKLSGDAFANGSGRVTLAQGKAKARIVELPGTLYINGNAAFWRATVKDASSKVVARLTGKWIRQPSDKESSVIAGTTPKRLASCLTDGLGTLSKAGTATVGGQPAIVLQDAGDKPGSTPGKYYFTTKPPILLLRAVQTGKTKPGKTGNKDCDDDTSDASTRSDLVLSQFGKAAKVTAPHGAVTPEQAAKGGSGSGGGSDAPSTPS
jgi:hypothetical protein